MQTNLSPETILLLLGLSFFFGLAFEERYAASPLHRPGGVRTFPLLSVTGAGLYLLEPVHALGFVAGLVILGAWIHAYYRSRWGVEPTAEDAGQSLIVPLCNLVAFILGPVVLTQPAWLGVGMTVVAVLLLGAKAQLHRLARAVPADEIITLAKFLVLTGIILPLLPNHPVTTLSGITPFQVWLAVVVVSALSYGSYLLRRFVSPSMGVMAAAFLGGLYSSTAATVVLARRTREQPEAAWELQAGIMLASTIMYLRLGAVLAVFNLPLARAAALPLLGLCLLGLTVTGLCHWRAVRASTPAGASTLDNPLELTTAAIFAAAFVIISLATAWMQGRFGSSGLYLLAAVVGVTDIDPFVLSLAQGGGQESRLTVLVVAILIAASTNNLLKAGYAVTLAGWRCSRAAAAALILLAMMGLVLAAWMAGLA